MQGHRRDLGLNESDLVDRVRDGKLSDAEVDLLVALLREHPDHARTYTRLNALGWLMRPDLASVVAPFLERADDPMLARLALQVLVHRFGLGLRFGDRVIEFADGVEWDDEDDVRLVALTCAGELAREGTRAPEMLRVLLRSIDADEDPMVRDSAYSGILRGLGRTWDETPGAGRVASGRVEIDPAVVAQVEALAR